MRKKPIHPLQRLRKRYGLNAAMAARLLGVTPNRIGQIESGFMRFPEELVSPVSKHFDIAEEELREELREFETQFNKYTREKLQSAK